MFPCICRAPGGKASLLFVSVDQSGPIRHAFSELVWATGDSLR